MSSHDMPIVKRIFLAQPRKPKYKAHWRPAPVPNENTSEDYMLVRPLDLGWAHDPFELYYHVSVVDELKSQVHYLQKRLEAHTDAIPYENRNRLHDGDPNP